ncbi:MAG: MurT ligase domain-containing protein [Lachnospiraceae bacterium]|nr:MurT ligase domain-containing protein [Ruminococcus sp.]MCM1275919.1 MurT ligase domain-containing protein [Lachnospiraceae bacterium]
MRKFFTILICKLAYFAGHLIGRGSSLPGEIALKMYPDILSKIKLPDTVIAVTGSNGKTSTVEMITHVLRKQGRRVVSNKEGSNLDSGIAAVILYNCTLGGRFKGDALVLETDERYAKLTYRYFSPTYYVVTNLYRDQLTRNGHPEWVCEYIRESVTDDCTLILNADDPLISQLGKGRENTVWFGMDKQSFSTAENTSVYDDGAFCPVCKSRMRYEYRHYNHIGAYICDSCGHQKRPTDFTVTSADLQSGVISINGKYDITLGFKSIYNVYNVLACFAACSLAGAAPESIAAEISDYVLKSGRVVEYTLGESEGTFLVSKHENSVSYDQSIRYILGRNEPCGVIIIVDAVSRRYSTGEISWLWDVDFELLNAPCVEHIYLLGAHAPDLEARFSYTDIPPEKITAVSDIDAAVNEIAAKKHARLYTVTCFSDKAKFLSKVTVK